MNPVYSECPAYFILDKPSGAFGAFGQTHFRDT